MLTKGVIRADRFCLVEARNVSGETSRRLRCRSRAPPHRCAKCDVWPLTPLIQPDSRPTRNFIRQHVSLARRKVRIACEPLVGGSKGAPGRRRAPTAGATSEGNATGMHARSAMSCLSRSSTPAVLAFGAMRRRSSAFAGTSNSRQSPIWGNEVTFRRWRECQVKRPLVPPDKFAAYMPDAARAVAGIPFIAWPAPGFITSSRIAAP
jgi:hypothetical protein